MNSDVDFAFVISVFSVCLFYDVILEVASFCFIFYLISSEFRIITKDVFVIVWNDFLRKNL